MDTVKLAADLVDDEDEKLKPYRCTAGKLTIGVGRNLEDRGLSRDESRYLLANDIRDVAAELDRNAPWWRQMSEPRQRALANMCFNLGWPRLSAFRNMLAALQAGDFDRAAREALDSRWADQVGKAPPGGRFPRGQRAWRIAQLIRQG